MKTKTKRMSISTEVRILVEQSRITSVVPIMTADQQKMLRALGIFKM